MKFLKYFFIFFILTAHANHHLYTENVKENTRFVALAICKASLSINDQQHMLKQLEASNNQLYANQKFCSDCGVEFFPACSNDIFQDSDNKFIFFSFRFDKDLRCIDLLFNNVNDINSVDRENYQPCANFYHILKNPVVKIMLIIEQEVVFERFFDSKFLQGQAFGVQGYLA